MNCSNLNYLPAELLLEIGDHFSDVDRACLALCSRECLHKLGTRLFSAYRRRFTYTREAFLSQLSRSTPSLIFYDCSLLHSWAGISTPYALGHKNLFFLDLLQKQSCKALDAKCSPICLFPSASYYNFKYLHLQLTMRRHHLGPDYGIDLSMLSYIEVTKSFHGDDPFYGEDIHCLTSIDALITPHPTIKEDCLYLRVQDRIHARGELAYIRDFLLWNIYMRICNQHWGVRLYDSKPLQSYDSMEKTYPSPETCLECSKCGVNVQIHMSQVQAPGTIALTMTRWFNLGAGDSPQEDTWANHGRSFVSILSTESGLVRQTFEEASKLRQADLTLRNNLLLQGEAYRKWLTPRSATPLNDTIHSFWDYRGDFPLEEVLSNM